MLIIASYFINRGLNERKIISASLAFLVGHWFYIIFNALLGVQGFSHAWGVRLFEENASLLISTSLVTIIGIFFYMLGVFACSKPLNWSKHSIINIRLSEKYILYIVALLFYIPGSYAALLSYQQAINLSFWERTTSLVSIADLIIPVVLIGFVGVATSLKLKKINISVIIFSIIIIVSVSSLLLLWSRRALLGVFFVLIMVLYERRYNKPSIRVFYYMVPLMFLGAIFLAFNRSSLYFDSGRVFDLSLLSSDYLKNLWLESSAFSSLMYSIEIYESQELLLGSSFFAAFIFFIPRAIFPDKPYSYELSSSLGDLQYNLPASFYGEVIANFGFIGVPILAFILGYTLKKIDYMYYNKPRNFFEFAIYMLFIFQLFFLVRGSFSTVFSAIFITCIMPLATYYFLRKLLIKKRRKQPQLVNQQRKEL